MRVALTAIGLMLIWQGLSLSLLIKATRRAWALLEGRSDVELARLGVGILLCVT
jgi:uncharacterized protein YjeT (DUF2065 family)